MGASAKTLFFPKHKPREEKTSLRKLRAWEKNNTGFVIIENPKTGKMNLWEIDKRNWSLEYTLFIKK